MSTLPIDDTTPIIVGVGQFVSRERPLPDAVLSAPDIAAEAARRALADSGAAQALAARIDVLSVVRFFEHSTRKEPMVSHPFGTSNNVPWSVARRVGLEPSRAIYSAVGGQSPQRMVNRMAEAIYRGEVDVALITGAEAIANIKHAVRNGYELDWREEHDDPFEDEWCGDGQVSDYEMAHGLYLPLRAYPLMEHSWRHALGLSVVEHRRRMGTMFAPFTAVAENNPHAQFPLARSIDELASVSHDNYLVSEPYTKWLVAQDAVNQGAAVIVTSVATAAAIGIPASQWLFLQAYADVDDICVINRPDFSRSQAQKLAIGQALASADLAAADIDHLDIYSCFPIAVHSACDALGIDDAGARELTLTGGLPYFGGPGNNYSMHAIAEVAARVRVAPDTRGVVVANGGYLSKHSVGVYGGAPHGAWKPIDSSPLEQSLAAHPRIEVAAMPGTSGIVESYVLTYKRGLPDFGYIVGRTVGGDERFMARVRDGDGRALEALCAHEPIGRQVVIEPGSVCNFFEFAI